jgi:tetratricopeptide (TPR) repeat protein
MMEAPSVSARFRRILGALTLTCVSVLPLASRSAEAAGLTEDQQRAHALVEQSAERFQQGRFQEAVDLLTEAHRLDPQPILLYNRARAFESMGDLDGLSHAADDYGQYLADSPAAKDRPAVEKRIEIIRAEIERLQRPPPQVPAAIPLPVRHPSAVPWILAGVGGLGLVTGATVGVLALTKHQAALNDPMTDTSQDNTTARSFATAANITLVAGGALAVVGVTWGLLDLRGARASVSPAAGTVHPLVGPRWAGLSVVIP